MKKRKVKPVQFDMWIERQPTSKFAYILVNKSSVSYYVQVTIGNLNLSIERSNQ